MSRESLLADIASSSDEVYSAVLPRVVDYAGTTSEDVAMFIVEASTLIDGQLLLREREKCERLRAIMSRLKPDAAASRLLATAARDLSLSLKNAVVGMLPKELRPLAYGKTASPPVIPPPEAQISASDLPSTQTDGAQDLLVAGTVLLLSKQQNQTVNANLLSKNDFASFRVNDVNALESHLVDGLDICACIIDGTYLNDLSRDDQLSLFKRLAAYSSFIWLRVEEGDHLHLSQNEIEEVLRDTRCRSDVTTRELSFQPAGPLRESEIASINSARTALSSVDKAVFIPGEITEVGCRLLVAAANEYNRERHLGRQVAVTCLHTEFITGGMTLEKIALVRINQTGIPVIAKIGARAPILEEVRRFNEFIRPWDNQLRPTLYLHADWAVILFGLVSDGSNPLQPAPTLENRLQCLWRGELYGAADAPNEADLVEVIRKATEKLYALNTQCCPGDTEFVCYCRPWVKSILHLRDHSITWGFRQDVFDAIDTANHQFDQMDRRAIVHGDAHIRNILVLDDRNGFLVDYGNSGPGHPATDLVRLELALYLRMFKQMADETRCAEFQSKVSLTDVKTAELYEAFPDLASSELNRVCIAGCVAARDQALKAVESHGGSKRDYLAAKYLTAWYSLTIDTLQAGLARSVISALATEINTWS